MRGVSTAPPDLAGLVQSMFGDLVDPDALVAKMGPDPSGVHIPGLIGVRTGKKRVRKQESNKRKAAEGIGLGATAIGTGYGIKELADHLPHAYPRTEKAAARVKLIGRGLVPQGVHTLSKNPKARVAAAGALLIGDATATAVLGSKPKDSVEKLEIPLHKLRIGRLKSAKHVLGGPPRVPFSGEADKATLQQAKMHTQANPLPGEAPKVKQTVPEAVQSGQMSRDHVQQLFSTTSGKVAAGGGLGVAYMAGKKRQQSQDVYKAEVDDVTFGGSFSKFDNDKQQAFGWASVVELNGEPVVDRQGDYIGIDDIEEAAYAYIRKSRVAGDMHRRTETDEPFKAGEVIESVVFTKDKCDAMGLPSSCAGKWWIGVQVDDEETWGHVKKQARTGFSIHGRGLRKDTTLDEIKGY